MKGKRRLFKNGFRELKDVTGKPGERLQDHMVPAGHGWELPISCWCHSYLAKQVSVRRYTARCPPSPLTHKILAFPSQATGPPPTSVSPPDSPGPRKCSPVWELIITFLLLHSLVKFHMFPYRSIWQSLQDKWNKEDFDTQNGLWEPEISILDICS